MTKFFAISALALTAMTGAASAMTDGPAFADQVKQYAPSVDVSALTAADVNAALTIIHGGDSEGEKRTRINALLK
ncbi:MAG: hypothetical protein MK160_16325 [Rhodobacteraceae bacterium]|nr:hypothetical protein [Paracoccaceae bacterium]